MVLPLIPLAVGAGVITVGGVATLFRKFRRDETVAAEQTEQERQDTRQAQIIATAPESAQKALLGATSPGGIDWEKIALVGIVVIGVAFVAIGALRK